MVKPAARAQSQVARFSLREGEGAQLDVQEITSVRPDGDTVISFGLNLVNAPVPARRYPCDAVNIVERDGNVKLLLGQRRIVNDGSLRSLLVVHMTRIAVVQVLRAIDNMKLPTLEEITEKMKLTASPVFEFREEPSQTLAVTANMGVLGVSGYETVFDLYHASAFSYAALRSSKKLAVEPVVRIDVSTETFMGLLARARDMARAWPDDEIAEEAT